MQLGTLTCTNRPKTRRGKLLNNCQQLGGKNQLHTFCLNCRSFNQRYKFNSFLSICKINESIKKKEM